MSRICEAFGCLPSEAVRELETDPDHLVLDILEARAYARCKEAYDDVGGKEDRMDAWTDSPILEAVERNAREIYLERRPRTGGMKQQIVLTDA